MLRLPKPVEGDTPEEWFAACVKQLDLLIARSSTETSPRLLALRDQVTDQWRKYIFAGGDPSAYLPSSFARTKPSERTDDKSDGDVLFDCYRSGYGADADIVSSVTSVHEGMCPYCGIRQRRKPNERAYDRDHAAPRSQLPEFSVLALNLISCCDDCNDAKGNRLTDDGGNWLFIHPYFDEFLSENLLSVSLAESPKALIAEYKVAADDLGVEDADRLTRHCETLDVLARLEDEALAHLRDLLRMVASPDVSVDVARNALGRVASPRLARHANDAVGLLADALSKAENLADILAIYADELSTKRRELSLAKTSSAKLRGQS